MSFKRAKCIAKNFIYLSLACICVAVVMFTVMLTIDYFIGELGVLIIVTIILIICLIYTAFDMCR